MSRIRNILADITFWWFWPRCPWCDQRTSNLELHVHTHHAGDDLIRSRT